MEQKRGVPTNSLSHSLASSPQIRDVCTAAVQHDTNNSKLLLLSAVFTTATTVAMSTTTSAMSTTISTATVAVAAATIPVATAVALERRRRDTKAAAFMAIFAALAVYQYYASNFGKTPQHTSGHNGRRWMEELLSGHSSRIKHNLGVSKEGFLYLE